jgi:hypothetical protein
MSQTVVLFEFKPQLDASSNEWLTCAYGSCRHDQTLHSTTQTAQVTRHLVTQANIGTMKQGASTSAIIIDIVTAADALFTSAIHFSSSVQIRVCRLFTFTANIIAAVPRINFRVHATMIAKHCDATVAV